MIVACAGCGTKYRVSDDKIGPFGVKVRCPKCRTVFEVKAPEEGQPESLAEKLFGKDAVSGMSSEQAAPERPAPQQSAPEDTRAPGGAAARGSAAARPFEPACATPAPPAAESAPGTPPAAPASAEMPAEPVTAPPSAQECVPPAEPAAAGTGRKPAFPFKPGEEDPRTLARALVSDILFYNRDSRDRGLADDRILACLGKEIARSWDTYKERVGLEAAVETDFFRQAVNEILGEGKTIL